MSWVPVAQACDTSYSGDRDWETHGSRPAWAKSFKLEFCGMLLQKETDTHQLYGLIFPKENKEQILNTHTHTAHTCVPSPQIQTTADQKYVKQELLLSGAHMTFFLSLCTRH
jgi:hypothetical protein